MGLSREESDRLDAKIAGRPYHRRPTGPQRTTPETDAEREEAEGKERVAGQRRRQLKEHADSMTPEERAAFEEKERQSKMSNHDIHEQLRAKQQFELDKRMREPLRAQVTSVEGKPYQRRATVFFDAKTSGRLIPSDNGEFTMDAGQFMTVVPAVGETPAVLEPIPPGDVRDGLRGALQYDPYGTAFLPQHGFPASWQFIVDDVQPGDDADQPGDDAGAPDGVQPGGDTE